MKTRLLLVLCAVLAFLNTSCTLTENITINADGSGSASFDMDGSGVMEMAGEKIAEESNNKRIDSTFTFKQLLADKKDSIAQLPKEEQERLKSLENFTIKMLMDPETRDLKMNMFCNFKKADELQDVMKAFSNFSSMKKKPGQPDLGLMQNGASVTYAYTGKKFSRKVKMQEQEEEKEAGEGEEMYAALFGSSTYELNYTFPKKVKKVSNKDAAISADGKTVTVIHPLTEFFDNPESIALEVEFE